MREHEQIQKISQKSLSSLEGPHPAVCTRTWILENLLCATQKSPSPVDGTGDIPDLQEAVRGTNRVRPSLDAPDPLHTQAPTCTQLHHPPHNPSLPPTAVVPLWCQGKAFGSRQTLVISPAETSSHHRVMRQDGLRPHQFWAL